MEPVVISTGDVRQPGGSSSSTQFRVQDPVTLVIFGATGDLAARKLFPALYALWHDRYLPPTYAIVGIGRRNKSDAEFRDELRKSIQPNCRITGIDASSWERFAARLFYRRADSTKLEDLRTLKSELSALDQRENLSGNRLYYMAIDPDLFPTTIKQAAAAGLFSGEQREPWARVIIEKPFGKDLASARELGRQILEVLHEDQIFRIDHYLGKETVQNLLAFRFGNSIFEPVFNRRYVDQVQITMSETVGMEGHRGTFYDHTGTLRDVVQNHLLQLLALVAMEPPAVLKAKEIRDEKVKVLHSIVPMDPESVKRWVVRGQYGAGAVDGKPVRAYREEEGISRDSITETYAALRVQVDSWRWAGVPFLIRAGKRLAQRMTEVAVFFKLPPLRLFSAVECEAEVCHLIEPHPNVLVFRIQPNEGIDLAFMAKRPGFSMELQSVRMDFGYRESFDPCPPEAYERLLLDAMQGDATLFMRSDEVEAAWEFITPILDAWKSQPAPSLPNYSAGNSGPPEAAKLTDGCQFGWRKV
jgi:glucose-6-phosphate 1-dehydrogenase